MVQQKKILTWTQSQTSQEAGPGPGPGPELGEDQRWTGDKPGTKLLIVQFC